jgi:hypothetical protein
MMRLRLTLLAALLQGLHRAYSSVIPDASSLQPGSSSDACTAFSPTWQVLNLTYDRTDHQPGCWSPLGTPYPFCHPTPLWYGRLAFDVVNDVTQSSHHCDVETIGLADAIAVDDIDQGQWLPCITGMIFIMTPEYVTDTMFKFNHTTNMLELNQTWSCAEGHNVTAVGSVSPVLDWGDRHIGDQSLGAVHVDAVSRNITVHGTVVSE